MKNILLDLTALTGFGAVLAGCYLKYGLSDSLVIGGSAMVIYSLAVAMRGKRAS